MPATVDVLRSPCGSALGNGRVTEAAEEFAEGSEEVRRHRTVYRSCRPRFSLLYPGGFFRKQRCNDERALFTQQAVNVLPHCPVSVAFAPGGEACFVTTLRAGPQGQTWRRESFSQGC